MSSVSLSLPGPFPGVPSLFCADGPPSPLRVASSADPVRPAPAESGISVLVVDDDDSVRNVIRLTLEHAGYRATVMSDGDAALEAFKRARFDLVITDMLMPSRDGIETIVSLRRLDPRIPIVAISGGGRYLASGDVLHTAKLLGVSRILPKPFDVSEMLAMVREVLGGVKGAAAATAAQ